METPELDRLWGMRGMPTVKELIVGVPTLAEAFAIAIRARVSENGLLISPLTGLRYPNDYKLLEEIVRVRAADGQTP